MKATEEQNSILERVVVNAMRVISDDNTGKQVKGFLTSGQSAGEGFSNALTFVLQTVVSGLLEKNVAVSPEILMSENGAVSQVAQLVVAMIEAGGGNITPNELQKGIEVSIHNFGRMLGKGAAKGAAGPNQGAPGPNQGAVGPNQGAAGPNQGAAMEQQVPQAPPQAPPQPQQPPPEQLQQPPPQQAPQGMLAGARA